MEEEGDGRGGEGAEKGLNDVSCGGEGNHGPLRGKEGFIIASGGGGGKLGEAGNGGRSIPSAGAGGGGGRG